ncbi:ribose-5-phosphate isomerase RpiA [Heyndrickxia ginsengihumi]|uniref:Ribose-5-phosphate isomerase A n=1 Tax=Heyndrickxia ginsengihumi TaxID=363870 RepID=A0A0A6VB41_9BACI|nr:ribose-5-phosphate isomerase RpiA [Heyndrickxia ginsengihumi]KHD85475.1 ribose 5-phosphate isomerase [Heyndrickxia ginsengihumi]MBE6183187.1 ribose-5-phosphate isomerase RpiA [Bacillus sp. (in: firmicutes)]MCM3023859.1 ribose-5-phosphate isomerase RpiA [Heyndrickxia ginsengihumi]NEY20720.1 ribose-5-phosphate isomerase RpiA [Heyndrickxia ginsengihumi]
MIQKKLAGEKAAEFVEDGMIVGLGSGSTVYYTIQKLGELVKNGLHIKGVSTSSRTSSLAASLGIQLVSLNEVEKIDLTIDGADEVDRNFNGIKGGGGALLFEKMVAKASAKNIWVVDQSKRVNALGSFPLPVEVIPFGYTHVNKALQERGFKPVLRTENGEPFQTDSHHYILDIHTGSIDDPHALHQWLKSLTGVVETGLFIDIADAVIVGEKQTASIVTK